MLSIAKKAAKAAADKARRAAAKKAAEAAKKKAAAKGKAEVTKAKKPPRVAAGGAGKGGNGDGPRKQVEDAVNKRLDRRSSEKVKAKETKKAAQSKTASAREKFEGKLGDMASGMRQNKKTGFFNQPKAEAGARATNMARGRRLQAGEKLQNSYNGKKAQLAWYRKNDPSSPNVAALKKQMNVLEDRAIIKQQKVEPKRPPGAKKPSEVRSTGIASTRKELMEVTQKLNTVGNQKLIANLKKAGKSVPRMTTKQVDDLKARKKMLQAKLDKMVK